MTMLRHFGFRHGLVFASLAAVLLALSACDKGDAIGSTVKGERVAIMDQAKVLTAVKDMASVKPQLSPAIVNMSWPQDGYDAAHVLPNAQVSAHPQIVWRTSIGQGSTSSLKLLAHPVADHGAIYTLDANGVVQATAIKTGERIWTYDTYPDDVDERTIGGGLALDGSRLFVTAGDGTVRALDAKSGKLVWQRSLGKSLRAAPTVSDNRVYVTSLDNQTNALDAGNGEILWHQEGLSESATLLGAAAPAIADDNAVAVYTSGEVFDLRPSNGRALWDYSLATAAETGALPGIADIRGLPVIDHNRVFVISHSGRMAAIDVRSGDRIWETEFAGIDTPVSAGSALFVYGGDNQMIAIDRDSGRIIWVRQLAHHVDPEDSDSDRMVWAGPVPGGGNLWMVNSAGALAAYTPADGSLVTSIDLGGPAYLAPVIVDRTMFVLTDAGDLVALR